MKTLIATFSFVTLLSAYPALAQWHHGGPGFRGPGPEGGMFLEQLIDPARAACRAGCFDTARTCRHEAETSASGPVQQDCSSQVTAAQSVCTPNPASLDACQSARNALYTCAQPTLTTLRSALRTCRNAAETCVEACNNS
jgi:hypothetical protein